MEPLTADPKAPASWQFVKFIDPGGSSTAPGKEPVARETVLACDECGTRKTKRTDSFALGLHSPVCLHCGHTGRTVRMLDGSVVGEGDEVFR